MGNDGTRGAALIRAAGGTIFAEDPSSCVIYGMPRSVIEAGCADRVVPLPDMARTIVDACTIGSERRAA
jgi:two-component system chemotaxis response regulator CheB